MMLRDRLQALTRLPTAAGKAWTAASFRTSTTELNAISQPGMMQAGIRHLPAVVIIGGG
ncbi:heme-binding protein [Bradyrhizobium daqingense]|uniref:heme-binding protein n=1 Tax=Bradyrhizobium daqingense TaxID=993502 RepID=UPI00384F2550